MNHSNEKILATIFANPPMDKSKIVVVLTPDGDNDFNVSYRVKPIGSVGSYIGTLDRPAGRLRIVGKVRKLWWSKTTGSRGVSIYGHYSRADAIRSLIAASR